MITINAYRELYGYQQSIELNCINQSDIQYNYNQLQSQENVVKDRSKGGQEEQQLRDIKIP